MKSLLSSRPSLPRPAAADAEIGRARGRGVGGAEHTQANGRAAAALPRRTRAVGVGGEGVAGTRPDPQRVFAGRHVRLGDDPVLLSIAEQRVDGGVEVDQFRVPALHRQVHRPRLEHGVARNGRELCAGVGVGAKRDRDRLRCVALKVVAHEPDRESVEGVISGGDEPRGHRLAGEHVKAEVAERPVERVGGRKDRVGRDGRGAGGGEQPSQHRPTTGEDGERVRGE